MQGNLLKLLDKVPTGAPAADFRQAVLQSLRHRLGLGLAREAGQRGSKFLSGSIPDVERHEPFHTCGQMPAS